MNIQGMVHESLKESVNAMQPTLKQLSELESKISEGRYSYKTLQDEIYPKQSKLKAQIDKMRYEALDKVDSVVEEYKKSVLDRNMLDPSKITDDVKLLSLPITLGVKDLQAIIERDPENDTMRIIVETYAKEHGITLASMYAPFYAEELRLADALQSVAHNHYINYIDRPDALDMLDKFIPNPNPKAVYTMPRTDLEVYKHAMNCALDKGNIDEYNRLKSLVRAEEAAYSEGVIPTE